MYGNRQSNNIQEMKNAANRCTYCGKEFTLKICLKTHLLKHAPNVPYDCSVCGQVLKDKCVFKKHMETHSNKSTLKDSCVKESFLLHQEYMKETSGALVNKYLKYDPSANDSLKSGVSFEAIPCKSGLETGTSEHYKKRHFSKFTLKKEEEVLSLIEESVKEEEMLSLIEESVKEDEFLSLIEASVKEEEEEEESLSVKEGKMLSLVEESIYVEGESHVKSDVSLKDDLQCAICSKTFSSRRCLETHILKHTSEKKSLKCLTCKDTFISEESLKNHVERQLHHCEKCDKFYSSCHNLKLHVKCHTEIKECRVCQKTFLSLQSLRKHELHHSEEERCAFCENEFPNKRALRLHLRKVHAKENKTVKCKVCGEKCTRSDLRKHRLSHAGNDTFQCEKCGMSFKELYKLKNHTKFHTLAKKSWACEVCGKVLSSKHSLQSHSAIHTNEQKCSVCTIMLPNVSALERHLLNKHSGKKVKKKKEKKVQCHICGSMYHKSYIETHLLTHSGEKNFSCDQCGMKFISQANLRSHKIVHTEKKKYKCEICNKGFSIRRTLRIHTRKHTGEKPYECTICSKRFVTSWTLKNHLRLHNPEEAFKCDICGKNFAMKKSLKAHYAGKAHSKEELQKLDSSVLDSISRKYECTICGKNCSEKTMLTFHMRTHTGEKPHKCSQCGKAFRVQSALNFHMTSHTGDRRFECGVCEKHFARRWQAKNHERLHSGVKPHLCTICGKAFFIKNSLKVHIERHASKKLYVCNVCGQEFTVKRICNTHQKTCCSSEVVCSPVSESGSLDNSDVVEHYETMNIKDSEWQNNIGSNKQSIECFEYSDFDFDIKLSRTQVIFSLSEDIDSIKEDIIIQEVDNHEFLKWEVH